MKEKQKRKPAYRYSGQLSRPIALADIRRDAENADEQTAFTGEFVSRLIALADTLDIEADEEAEPTQYWYEFAIKLAARHVPGLAFDADTERRKPGAKVKWDSTARISLVGVVRAKRAANSHLTVADACRNIKADDARGLFPSGKSAGTYERQYYEAAKDENIIMSEAFYAGHYGADWFVKMRSGKLSFDAPTGNAFKRYLFELPPEYDVRKSSLFDLLKSQ